MKKTLFLLSLAGSLALPAATYADQPVTKSKKTAKPVVAQAKATHAAPAKQKTIFYITDAPRTGSAIPMVYRQYDGRIDSASNAAVYGQTDLQRTGNLDVATELSQLDTSISLGGHR